MLKHAVLAAAFSIGFTALPAAAADWTKVAKALGKSGAEMAGGVYRVGMPRTDLNVTLDGVEIKPALRARLLARLPRRRATRRWSWAIWCSPTTRSAR